MSAEYDELDTWADPPDISEQPDELTRLRAEVARLSSLILKAHGALPENWVYTDSETTIDLLIAEVKSLRHKLGEWETPMTCGHPRALVAVEEEYHCYVCQVTEPLKQENEGLRKQIAEHPDTKRLEAFFEADRYDVCPTLRKGMPNAFGHTWYFGYPNYHHRGSGNTPREAIDRAMEKAK